MRIALRDAAGELRSGFDQEHAGEDRLSGEVAAQEGFVAAHGVFAGAGLAGFERDDSVEEAEFGAVRQGVERIHWAASASGSVILYSGPSCGWKSASSILGFICGLLNSFFRTEPSMNFMAVAISMESGSLMSMVSSGMYFLTRLDLGSISRRWPPGTEMISLTWKRWSNSA